MPGRMSCEGDPLRIQQPFHVLTLSATGAPAEIVASPVLRCSRFRSVRRSFSSLRLIVTCEASFVVVYRTSCHAATCRCCWRSAHTASSSRISSSSSSIVSPRSFRNSCALSIVLNGASCWIKGHVPLLHQLRIPVHVVRDELRQR